jgi:hypothetical protein
MGTDAYLFRQFLFNHKLMGVLCKLTFWCTSFVENTSRTKASLSFFVLLFPLLSSILVLLGKLQIC